MNRSLRKHLQNQFLGNVEASLLICRIRPPSGSEASSNGLQSEGLVSSLRCYWEVKDRAGVGEVAHLWGGGDAGLPLLFTPQGEHGHLAVSLPQCSGPKQWGQTSIG